MSEIIDFSNSEFVHLGLGSTTLPLPPHTGSPDWYETYGEAHADDGDEGRLVSLHTFAEPWDTWEMHPRGTELVLCVDGTLTLHQEHPDGSTETVTLCSGQAVINDPGVWHTADVDATATALFITAGAGTEMRPR